MLQRIIKRYPLVKHMVGKQELPHIDDLPQYERHHLQVRQGTPPLTQDDSIIFKSQILPKEMEEIWLEVFNCINMIVNILKPPHTESALLKMPSLRCKEFLVSESINRRNKSYVVTLNNKESEEEKQKSIKLGSEVFYGYPLEHSGQVEAILTFTSFEYTKDFDGLSYYLDDYGRDYADPKIVKARCKEVFDYASATIMKKEQSQINWRNTKCLVFLKDTMQFVRCLDGSFTRVFSSDKHTTYSIVPAELISSNRTYENTPDNIHFRSIEEEFRMGEDVVVFPDGRHDRQRQALKSKVVGYSNRRVKVQVGNKIKAIDDKTLSNFVHTRELFFNLNLAAFLVETRSSILLTLGQHQHRAGPLRPPSLHRHRPQLYQPPGEETGG